MSPSSEPKSSTSADHSGDYVPVLEADLPAEASTSESATETYVMLTSTDGDMVTYSVEQLREAQLKAKIRKLLQG